MAGKCCGGQATYDVAKRQKLLARRLMMGV